MKNLIVIGAIGLFLVGCARDEDAGYTGGTSQTEVGTGTQPASPAGDPNALGAVPETPTLPPASDTVTPATIPGTAAPTNQQGKEFDENQNLDSTPTPPQ